jgi:hypothetical protein
LLGSVYRFARDYRRFAALRFAPAVANPQVMPLQDSSRSASASVWRAGWAPADAAGMRVMTSGWKG